MEKRERQKEGMVNMRLRGKRFPKVWEIMSSNPPEKSESKTVEIGLNLSRKEGRTGLRAACGTDNVTRDLGGIKKNGILKLSENIGVLVEPMCLQRYSSKKKKEERKIEIPNGGRGNMGGE